MFLEQTLYVLFLLLRSIYSSGRKHALRKTSYLTKHICYASAVCLRRKLTFTAIFLAQLTDQFDASFNPKNASETNATSNTSTRKTYEFSCHRCLTLNFGDNANHWHNDRYKSNGPHRCTSDKLVLRVRGCRMTKIQAQLYGMQTQQGALFNDLLVAENILGWAQTIFPEIDCRRLKSLVREVCRFPYTACFLPLDYAGKCMAAAEKTNFTKKRGGGRIGV